jgi:colanic acid biosynthesis glycosyl transferase WcaI
MVGHRRWFHRGSTATAETPGQPAGSRVRTGGPHGRIGIDPGTGRVPQASNPGAPDGPEGAGRRILFINQYYWPDHASTAQHLTDLAESMAERGYECHVLCAQGRYQPGEPKPPAFEVHEGVRIHRVPATSLGRRGTWARMTDYLSFYAGAVIKALLLPRFDAVVTLTTPPIIGLVGTFLKWIKGTRHAYWSMDLHPDASLALGRMSPTHPVVRLFYWLSGFVYRQADRVVVLGPYMADRIALKHVHADRVETIPVWSRREEIYPIPRAANSMRKSMGLDDAFVVMYSGNLGLAHSFEEFLAAARVLRDRRDIVFLFVGGGPRLAEVKAIQEREGLANVRFLDYVPRSHLHVSLSMADVHLISMRPEMTGIVAPGKLYGVMAAGRAAVFVGPEHCETADTIRLAGCGVTLAPGDVEGLIASITYLADDPSLARRMGERGRSSFLAAYERNLGCNLWRALLDELMDRSGARVRMAVAPTRPTASARRAGVPLVLADRG